MMQLGMTVTPLRRWIVAEFFSSAGDQFLIVTLAFLAAQKGAAQAGFVLASGAAASAVAAVVAGAAGNPDSARVGCQRQRQPRRGQAGALHQGVGWQARLGRRLDVARGGDVEQRGRAAERQRARHAADYGSRAFEEVRRWAFSVKYQDPLGRAGRPAQRSTPNAERLTFPRARPIIRDMPRPLPSGRPAPPPVKHIGMEHRPGPPRVVYQASASGP